MRESRMSGRKDRCLDGKTDVWMKRQMSGWKDRCLDGKTDEQTVEGKIDRQMDRRAVGQMYI
jgi:hypothetical protein